MHKIFQHTETQEAHSLKDKFKQTRKTCRRKQTHRKFCFPWGNHLCYLVRCDISIKVRHRNYNIDADKNMEVPSKKLSGTPVEYHFNSGGICFVTGIPVLLSRIPLEL